MKTPTEADYENNPFAYKFTGFGWAVTIDAVSRIELVKQSESVSWLRRVIEFSGTQKTVGQAAARRIRVLTKENKAA